jgi:hypothetical protein
MNPARSPAPTEQHLLDRPWRVWASVAISVFVLVSVVLGFWIVPASQSRDAGFDPFAAMCRAIGISPFGQAATARANAAVPRVPTSEVMWTTDTLHLLGNADIGQGAAVAGRICVALRARRFSSDNRSLTSSNSFRRLLLASAPTTYSRECGRSLGCSHPTRCACSQPTTAPSRHGASSS